MSDLIDQDQVDQACDFLQVHGWSFGWCQAKDKEKESWNWQAHAIKGNLKVEAGGKVLGDVLRVLQTKIVGMN